jgi:flagellar motility protein MotE (MotC chaperone)
VGVSQTLEILQSENPHVPLLPRDIYNARAAINRNPQKVATGLAENRPAIYSKPHPSAEERIRADLRRELANAREELDKLKRDSQKEIEELKAKLQEKENMIKKFEEFIDICNGRVMVSLSKKDDGRGGGAAAS